MSQQQQDKEEETNKDGEESNNNLSFGSGIIPAFGAGLQQPTFDFTGGDFSYGDKDDHYSDTGYQVKVYQPNGHYDWHSDYCDNLE